MTNPCPFCHSDVRRWAETRDLNRKTSAERYLYLRCNVCGLVFLDNPPADLGPHYPESYYDFPDSPREVERRSIAERYKVDLIKKFGAGPRLLELGPAWGSFLLAAQSADFEVVALEMDARCCEYLERTTQAQVIRGDDLTLAGSGFDVICAWQVIEHMRFPERVIMRAAEMLSEAGILVLATPNPDSFQARLFGSRWTHIDAPRHLFLLPIDWLEDRAKEAGLDVAGVSFSDPGAVGWNSFGWQQSLGNLFEGRTASKAARLVGRMAGRALRGFETGDRRVASYTTIFRKSKP